MATVTVLVCDKCDSQGEVETYELKKGSERASVDLCEACAAPLDELLAIAEKRPPAPRGGPARRPRQKVTTIEEIEAMKARKK